MVLQRIGQLLLLLALLVLVFTDQSWARRRSRPRPRRPRPSLVPRPQVPTRPPSSRCPLRLVCEVKDASGDDLDLPLRGCAENSTCSLGPMEVASPAGTKNGPLQVKFCDSRVNGELELLHHACRIILDNGTVVRNDTSGSRARPCAIGPLAGDVTYDGQPAQAYFRQPPRLPAKMRKLTGFRKLKKKLEELRKKVAEKGGSIREWFQPGRKKGKGKGRGRGRGWGRKSGAVVMAG